MGLRQSAVFTGGLHCGGGFHGFAKSLHRNARRWSDVFVGCDGFCRYGRRLVFMSGVVLFTLASLLCGLAWSITALDVARALQGIGGAALFATALALIGHEYRGADRFAALAVWGATIGAAVACGPLIGGLLTDGLGWRKPDALPFETTFNGPGEDAGPLRP